MIHAKKHKVIPSWHKVLITGDRDWARVVPIRKVLVSLRHRYGSKLIVIEGGARGADLLAEEVAKDLGIHVARVPALWDYWEEQGNKRAAGPVRNAAMLEALEPDEVIAFHENLHKSRGTKHMVERARKAGVRVRIHRGG